MDTEQTWNPFTLEVPPGTDLWRKPPSHNVVNAPQKWLNCLKMSSFKSAGVTFSASWTKRYDQAGLVISFPKTHEHGQLIKEDERWVKAGVEFYQGKPQIGIVATDRWADWSLAPVAPSSSAGQGSETVSIEMRSEGDELGKSLWIYQMLYDAEGNEVQRVPLRECTWAMSGDQDAWIQIAAYGARPATTMESSGGEASLKVNFAKAWVKGVA